MIQCDSKKVELGIIVSKKALRVLNFLEGCAGAPEPAISLIFPGCARFLRILRGSGYARRCWTPGQDALWVPVQFPVPKNREEYVARSALGWLAARLVEAGGRMDRGRAIFPNGKAYRVGIYPGAIHGKELVLSLNGEFPDEKQDGCLYVNYQNLKERMLKECLVTTLREKKK